MQCAISPQAVPAPTARRLAPCRWWLSQPLQVPSSGKHRSHRRQRQAASCALSPQDVFSATTVLALPLYTLMIAAPKRPLTQRLMGSPLFFALATAAYAAQLLCWGALPAIWAIAKATLTSGGLPSMASFAAAFHNPALTALAWLHLVLLDLFQARWVYLDGLKQGVPTAHSLVLCFMVGPLGLASHLVTSHFTRARSSETAASPSAA